VVWVYVIQNAEYRFYIGMTTDLEKCIENLANVEKRDPAPSCARLGSFPPLPHLSFYLRRVVIALRICRN
jgi:hypothetical protein